MIDIINLESRFLLRICSVLEKFLFCMPVEPVWTVSWVYRQQIEKSNNVTVPRLTLSLKEFYFFEIFVKIKKF